MAASKLHLKNVNKDYKLEVTDKRTNEGRIVYKNTKTGELHSELSMTLEMPEGSGNWINVPSLINGRVYNVQGVLDMLKAGNIEPNSTGHKSETAAVEAAIFRSNNLLDDVGVSLKPNNEVDLKNNDPKIVRAFQPAYTTARVDNADGNLQTRNTNAAIAAYEADKANNELLVDTQSTGLGLDGSTTKNSVFIPHIKAGTDGGDTKWTGWGGGISEKGLKMVIKNKRERREAAAKKAEIERGTAILNQLDVEKDDSYFQRPIARNINDPFTTTQYLNPRGLADREANMARGVEDRAVAAEEAAIAEARKREEIIGQTMSAYGPRTGQSPIPKDAVFTYWDGRAYNGAIQMINNQPHDAAGQELIVNDAGTIPVDDTNQAMLAKAAEEKILEDSTKDDNRTFGQRFKDAMSRVAGIAEMSYPAPAESVRGFERAESLFDVPNKIDLIHSQSARLAEQEGLYDDTKHRGGSERGDFIRQKRQEMIGKAMSSYGPRTTPEMDTGTRSRVELSDITSGGPQSRSGRPNYDSDGSQSRSGRPDYDSRGPKTRQSNKPKSKFEYKPHMTPEQKMNATLENVTLSEYGEMPGFKLPTDDKGKSIGNYWSVDETSPFWQTDAGYEKAMQTWGEKPGWVKPGFRPKKQELDINAIKKWFTSSK